MVAGADHDALGAVVLEEVKDTGKGLVVCQNLVNLGSRVVAVAGVVNPASLNHEEETFLAVLRSGTQSLQSGPRHLVKGRIDVALVPPVDFVGNVGIGKETKQRELDGAAQTEAIEVLAAVNVVEAVFLLGQGNNVPAVGAARALGRVGQEVAAATTEHEVYDTAERVVADHLLGDAVFFGAHVDMSSKAGGGGVSDAGGDDQAGHVAGALGGLQHGSAGRVIGQDRDGTIVTLEAAGEGGCAGGRVGNQAAGRAGARLADQVLVDDQRVVPGLGVLVLLEATRK